MSCATRSGRIADVPKPMAVDPQVCAAKVEEPRFPHNASIPKAVTPEESQAMQAFLLWVQQSLDWGKLGWYRFSQASEAVCK